MGILKEGTDDNFRLLSSGFVGIVIALEGGEIMALHTFLVVGKDRGDFSGEITHVQEGKGKWGKKEVPPAFEFIEFNGTREEVNWIFRCCRWSFYHGVFVHKDNPNTFFDRVYDVVVHTKDFGNANAKNQKDKALAKLLTNVTPITACSVLRASHAGEFGNDERSYWVKHYWPFRKEEGVKGLIEAAKYGVYADCRAAFRKLNKGVQDQILSSGSERDRKYLRWLFVANNADEAAEFI